MNFTALDFEMGFNRGGGICEVGVAVVRDGAISESRAWLIRPRDNQINKWNKDITGITPEMTANAPSFPEVWDEIFPYLNGNYIIAHNAKSAEISWLRKTLDLYKLPYPQCTFYCSINAAKRVLELQQSYNLEELCKNLGIQQTKAHRAEGDAIACAALFLKLLEKWHGASSRNSDGGTDWTEYFEGIAFVPLDCNPLTAKRSKTRSEKGSGTSHANGSMLAILTRGPLPQFQGKIICITGKTRYSRKQMVALVEGLGAIVEVRITKKTDILLVGEENYNEYECTGNASKKLRYALTLRESGGNIEILNEGQFFNILSDKS